MVGVIKLVSGIRRLDVANPVDERPSDSALSPSFVTFLCHEHQATKMPLDSHGTKEERGRGDGCKTNDSGNWATKREVGRK